MYLRRNHWIDACVVHREPESGLTVYGASLLPRDITSYSLAIKMCLQKLKGQSEHVLFQFSDEMQERIPELRNVPRFWRVDFLVPETIQ